ncbi:hypothetical protein Zm00014a_018733 [Zea mays]|uniref:Uncharacterized protein n=1 Tax=Zea mays TaxID=4577 RepID=A0A3L6G3V6_MAIZE|nr:hypothetical protein Zm00014a_018733 [Zea mays]
MLISTTYYVSIVGVHSCQWFCRVAARLPSLPPRSIRAASTPAGSASPSHCAAGPAVDLARRRRGSTVPPPWHLGSPPWTPWIQLLLLSPLLRRLLPPHTSTAPLLPPWISPRHSRLPPRPASPPLSLPPPP